MRPGLMPLRSSYPRPHFSSVPGLKFSTTTSASEMSRRARFCPSPSRRLMVIDFLLRAIMGHQGVPLFAVAAPHAHGISLAWRLELYDFGAEVREELAAERTCQQAAHLDYTHAFERAGPVTPLSHSYPPRGLL